MADLIIAKNKNEIDAELMNQEDGYNVSKKYVNISTQDVLDEIERTTGFKPNITGFNKSNVRKEEKKGKQKHAIICEMPNSEMVDGTYMNLIILNSHDRSSALKIYLGAVRKVCSNGLVLSGSEDLEPVSITHTQKDWKYTIQGMMREYEAKQEKAKQMIENMIAKKVTPEDIMMFTSRVKEELIDPSITGSILDGLELNLAHRKEDTPTTLWHMFNRVQSNMMEGGVQRIIEKDDPEKPGTLMDVISKTHKITDHQKGIEMNAKLMTMATDMLNDTIVVDAEPVLMLEL